MKLKFKHVIIFAIVVVIIAIILWDRDLKIKSVFDGNTVELSNGVTVRLIGVSSTQEGKDYLKTYINCPVSLQADGSNQFEINELRAGMIVYAYVVSLDNKDCLNARMLRKGVCELLEETYLVDSLEDFRGYAAKASRRIAPTPIPVEPIVYENDDIILPTPPSPSKRLERKHSIWYTNGNLNLEMLEEACDYNCPYTKQFANSLAAKSPGPYNPGQICEIFDYCYNKWRYVNDPKDKEYVASASESIEGSLVGDCDDFAVLMASCILAVGGRVCINTGQTETSGHAFTEVDISQFDESSVLNTIKSHFSQYNITSLATRRDGDRLWMNLDWQAAYPGGRYWMCSERDSYPYEDGRWTWKKLF